MTRPALQTVRTAARALIARLDAVASGDEAAAARAIDDCLRELDSLGLTGTDNRLASSELWNVAGPLLERGWLQNRARTKPRGYAGDYELIERIYHRRACDDPLGRLFDAYFQAQAAPQAVRNRMAMITEWIIEAAGLPRQKSLHVALVGSAAGLEIDAALRQLPAAPLRITLLDLDPAAIEYAQKLLSPHASAVVSGQPANLFRLAERPQIAAPLAGADMIFCPGLLDYLDDQAAARMLRALYESLAPAGRLIVFQFAPHNPTRAYMEWFANWYLIYRTRDQLQRVVEAARLSEPFVEYGAEPLGIDLYVSLLKPR